jgi:hypothetical protein
LNGKLSVSLGRTVCRDKKIKLCTGLNNISKYYSVFKFQAVWTTSYHTQFQFIRTKYQGEFSLVEGFKLAFLREIIYSSCQKIFLKCLLKRREDTFWGGKSESRVSAPFFASKTVNLCPSHKINANIGFLLIDWFTVE